jgi:glycerol transport system permease protein
VLVLVAFSAVIPLMTVVNYSVQDTFGDNQFFWAGLDWFEEMLHSDRLWDALAGSSCSRPSSWRSRSRWASSSR